MNRGADVVARTLVRAGVKRVFALSGNHVMSIFDAAPAAGLDLVHVRHEAASVHMADAWARLTGEVGVALATGGPGHANAVPALYTALASESPVVLLSGHSPLDEMGRGAFQEMRQADLAAPLAKASWAVTSAAALAADVARAMRIAAGGRPGPVHLSLPSDALDAVVADVALPHAGAFAASPAPLAPAAAEAMLGELARAARPLILVGPALVRGTGREATRRLEAATRIPLAGMESPRGLSEPALGALAEMLPQADLVLLLGKPLDFGLKFGRPPAIAPGCRFVHVDPDPAILERTAREVGARLAFGAVADSGVAAAALAELAAKRTWPKSGWFDEVRAAIAYRPAAWTTVSSARDGRVHPVEVCRAVQRILDRHEEAVLVSDGGEFGQWAQACLTARHRVTNGPAGAIGAAVPFAVAARLAFPAAPVVAMSGDGSIGFHLAEYDTAVRHDAPFVAVVGNDARWNAEHQIQIRAYGAERAVGCELLPTRYDLVAAALGGHGEHVERAADLAAALDRAFASRRPACVNVAIEGLAAPDLSKKE
ncbi:MAG: thiamine pyrophosphate-binding protein [Burkholderiales bacterium]